MAETKTDGGGYNSPPPIDRKTAFADPYGQKKVEIPPSWESLSLFKRFKIRIREIIAKYF